MIHTVGEATVAKIIRKYMLIVAFFENEPPDHPTLDGKQLALIHQLPVLNFVTLSSIRSTLQSRMYSVCSARAPEASACPPRAK